MDEAWVGGREGRGHGDTDAPALATPPPTPPPIASPLVVPVGLLHQGAVAAVLVNLGGLGLGPGIVRLGPPASGHSSAQQGCMDECSAHCRCAHGAPFWARQPRCPRTLGCEARGAARTRSAPSAGRGSLSALQACTPLNPRGRAAMGRAGGGGSSARAGQTRPWLINSSCSPSLHTAAAAAHRHCRLPQHQPGPHQLALERIWHRAAHVVAAQLAARGTGRRQQGTHVNHCSAAMRNQGQGHAAQARPMHTRAAALLTHMTSRAGNAPSEPQLSGMLPLKLLSLSHLRQRVRRAGFRHCAPLATKQKGAACGSCPPTRLHPALTAPSAWGRHPSCPMPRAARQSGSGPPG